jgi:hypothetical protein
MNFIAGITEYYIRKIYADCVESRPSVEKNVLERRLLIIYQDLSGNTPSLARRKSAKWRSGLLQMKKGRLVS